MSIDPNLGTLRWTPTADQLGAQSVVIRVTDPQGAFATQSYSVTVRGGQPAAVDQLDAADPGVPG